MLLRITLAGCLYLYQFEHAGFEVFPKVLAGFQHRVVILAVVPIDFTR